MIRSRLLTATAIVASSVALAACGDDDDDTAGSKGDESATVATAPETIPAEPAGACKDVPAPDATTIDTPKPSGDLKATDPHVVTLTTSCGTIEITLDTKNHPKVAKAFAALVQDKAYDGLGFHRVVPGFVIQGGDPDGTGGGGPKWNVVEKPNGNETYTRGVVAMAKTAQDPPGSAGSQFFIVTGADAGLPPEYAVAGKVTKGIEAADAISALGQEGADGPPTKPAVIEKATIK